MSAPKPTMMVGVSFFKVPMPEVADLLGQLSEAGWEWEKNYPNWIVSFRKNSIDEASAMAEVRELMGDYWYE